MVVLVFILSVLSDSDSLMRRLTLRSLQTVMMCKEHTQQSKKPLQHDSERIQLIQRHLQSDMKTYDFAHEDPVGCLKDPRQQSMKVEKMKSMNHEVFKTQKIIENGSLSMILGASEEHHTHQANY